MTKKNKDKIAARDRNEKLGGKYQAHLRIVGGARGEAGGGKPPGFFDGIANAIRGAFPALVLTIDLPNHRIFVLTASRELIVCTPTNIVPDWPVFVLLPETPEGDTPSWECEDTGDLLTVLRWPQASPSGHYASPNEIRDDLENDAKHAWQQTGRMGPMYTTLVECTACKARLYLNFDETVEKVARMGFNNWRKMQAGTLRGGSTLSRSMGVAAIPPQCPGRAASAPAT